VNLPQLTLRALRARAVEVPMKLPLGTSAGTLRSAALLLIDLETEEGVTGRSYLFCYLPGAAPAIAAMLAEAERTVKGARMAHAVEFTLIIKGNDVVSIDPRGKEPSMPLYQRDKYRENKTRWIKRERFAPVEEIHW